MRTCWTRFAAAVAALVTALALPSAATAQTPVVLDATIAEGTPRYFAVPFTVPAGIVEIEVRHDDLSAMNVLDWGLRDTERFRGWGGGNSEPAVVSVQAASRSYLTGPIPAGQWSLLIGQAKIVERPARYHVEIFMRTTATLAPQPERRPYVHAAALSTGPRWYAGDFHVHSRESGDADPTLDAIAIFARTRGLDFVELSDHNTVSQLDLIGDAQSRHPDFLYVPGFEFTTYSGHANALGATRIVDFTLGSSPAATIGAAVDAIAAQNAVLLINHPVLDLGERCIGCAWQLDVPAARVGAIEIQNGGYSVTGALFYRRATMFWETYLAMGAHVAPVGGSDDHSGGIVGGSLDSPMGSPTTMVFATELSVPAITAAVAAGRTVVKLQGPDDPMCELHAGEAMIGDTVRTRQVTLLATVTRGMGSTLRMVRNGVAVTSVPVNADPFTNSMPIDAPPGTADDRWRCELTVAGSPRVVTGHIWVAATGDPIPVDAGPTTDAGPEGLDVVADAGGTPRMPGACGCRTVPSSRAAWGSFALLLGLLARRRRA